MSCTDEMYLSDARNISSCNATLWRLRFPPLVGFFFRHLRAFARFVSRYSGGGNIRREICRTGIYSLSKRQADAIMSFVVFGFFDDCYFFRVSPRKAKFARGSRSLRSTTDLFRKIKVAVPQLPMFARDDWYFFSGVLLRNKKIHTHTYIYIYLPLYSRFGPVKSRIQIKIKQQTLSLSRFVKSFQKLQKDIFLYSFGINYFNEKKKRFLNERLNVPRIKFAKKIRIERKIETKKKRKKRKYCNLFANRRRGWLKYLFHLPLFPIN